jgi:glutamate racemase
MKLGVFDSGIGGEAVAHNLRQAFPHADVISISDPDHVPYGTRSTEDIIQLTDTAIQPLLTQGCDVIVLACNTATAAAIETLRSRYPHQAFIGLEPMIKPAAEQTQTGVVAVLATPATLASTRYHTLKSRYPDLTVIEPDCSDWAYLIENNAMNRERIEKTVRESIEAGADIIVLGCTHYHWIANEIREEAHGKAVILEPSDAIARRVQSLLATPTDAPQQ